MITERRNPRSVDIDLLPTERVLKIINADDAVVANVVASAIPQIAKVVETAAECIRSGGRIIYIGAGTSGRLAILDAVEIPPTFSTPPEWIQAVMAGGAKALPHAIEGSEDDRARAAADLKAKKLTKDDLVIGIAASGNTPYTHAAVEFAKSKGAKTVAVVCVENSPLSKTADLTIQTLVGPEVITGSTRMKAGTAQKLVLNMISTATMIRLGMTYSNWMINLSMKNNKLRDRGIHVLQEILGVRRDEAARLAESSGSNLKVDVIMEGTYESLNVMSRTLSRHGTTSFLATTVSSPPDVLTAAIEKLGALIPTSFDGAQPIGIHLEGPFISTAKRGTHRAANVIAPDAGLLEKWIRAANKTLRLVTLAPELPGADELVPLAREQGVSLAMGHSNATFEQARSAVERGFSYAVHTFNAMRAFSHRGSGIVGEVLADDRIFAEIIPDGVHVDPAVVRLFGRAKGKERVLLVSDAISATGMPDGRYVLGGDTVEVVNGVCRDGEGRLAGSTLTQEIALQNFAEWTAWSIEDALLGLTLNPARALRLEKKGVLDAGADADVVLMDHSFRVMKTYVKGKLVFDRLWTN